MYMIIIINICGGYKGREHEVVVFPPPFSFCSQVNYEGFPDHSIVRGFWRGPWRPLECVSCGTPGCCCRPSRRGGGIYIPVLNPPPLSFIYPFFIWVLRQRFVKAKRRVKRGSPPPHDEAGAVRSVKVSDGGLCPLPPRHPLENKENEKERGEIWGGVGGGHLHWVTFYFHLVLLRHRDQQRLLVCNFYSHWWPRYIYGCSRFIFLFFLSIWYNHWW